MSAADLGRDGILHAADFLDSAIEVVSVARNDAHHQLQIRLHSGEKEDRKASFCTKCLSGILSTCPKQRVISHDFKLDTVQHMSS